MELEEGDGESPFLKSLLFLCGEEMFRLGRDNPVSAHSSFAPPAGRTTRSCKQPVIYARMDLQKLFPMSIESDEEVNFDEEDAFGRGSLLVLETNSSEDTKIRSAGSFSDALGVSWVWKWRWSLTAVVLHEQLDEKDEEDKDAVLSVSECSFSVPPKNEGKTARRRSENSSFLRLLFVQF